MSNKAIYKFLWDCSRSGCVESLFVATTEEVQAAMDKEVYFGEILGKHSEVHGVLSAEDLTVVTDDQEFIAKFEQILGDGFSTGHNPLDYIDYTKEEEDEEED